MDTGPFRLCAPDERAPRPRGIDTPDGVGDRMRTAAFAELQAIHAFRWAAATFDDAPDGLRDAWLSQVPDEELHYAMIMERMAELGVDPAERPVSLWLWRSLEACTTAREFCLRIVLAEERGRRAGSALSDHLAERDPATAAVFRRIVDDEVGHVALAETWFGWRPDMPLDRTP